jgi:hypothetical protein
MANTLRFKRGLVATIPTALAGEPLFTTDTFDLYIGNGTTNTRFQKYIASGASTQLLRGDGSLLTMPIVLTSPANGQVLKYNGTSWVNDSDAGITGSGSAGQVAYFTGATTQAGSNNLFFDSANIRLGIGTAAPSTDLHISRAGSKTLRLTNTTNSTDVELGISTALGTVGTNTANAFAIVTSNTERMRITPSTGNVHIGTFVSDSGQRLQVTGDTLLKGSGNTSATTALTVQNSASTNMFRVKNDGFTFTNFGTYIGTSDSNVIAASDATGNSSASGLNLKLLFGSFNTAGYGLIIAGFNTSTRTATSGTSGTLSLEHGFAPTSGTGTFIMLSASGTINQTGGANGITRGFYVAPTLTAAADWRSIEWSNNSGWGLYGAGTAANFVNGALGVGTSTMTYKFNVIDSAATYVAGFRGSSSTYIVVGDTSLGGESGINLRNSTGQTFITQSGSIFDIATFTGVNVIRFQTTGTEAARITATNRNFHIGTFSSDSGEKLQVTGTAKITGATTLGATTISTSSSTALAINSSASACYLGMSDSSGSFTYLGSDNGAMLFQTPASSYSTKMTLDSSGNLGLGVTPSAWAILKGLQVGLTASISGYAATTEGMFLMSNSFYNGGAFVYQVNGFATTYLQQNGEHRFQTAASGTAGNNITFTRPMTLTAAGRLLLGTTVEGTNLLDVVGTARITGDLAVDTNTLFVDATNNRVGVLTTTPSEPLHVAGNMLISGANSFKMRNLAGTDVNVIRAVSGGTSVLSTATLGNNIAIGTQSAHDFLLCSSDTERIRLSSSGWFSHTTATNPSSSVTDSYVQYSADVTAGNAAPHFRTENGAVIKLYQETTAVGNSIISLGGGNSVLDDTTFDGYTLRQIVKALRNQGILA